MFLNKIELTFFKTSAIQWISTFWFLLTVSVATPTIAQSQAQIASEYLQQGEYEKARQLFEVLAEDPGNTQIITADYLSTLEALEDYQAAERFLLKSVKTFPNNLQYKANLAGLYQKTASSSKFQSYLDRIFQQAQRNPFELSIIAQYLVNENLYTPAVRFFKASRELRGDISAHALELAAVYRALGDKPAMITEYLNYAADNNNRLNYIKNILQNFIKEEEDLSQLESTLINKMQEHPEDLKYPELLIWVELQRKNFYGAFIQARAIDRRTQKAGNRCMQIAQIALDNKDYDVAEEIFAYVAKQYPYGRNYAQAKKQWINTRELKIKNTYPINTDDIRVLTKEYELLYQELRPKVPAFEALRNKALLHAFYLGETEKAVQILDQLVRVPQAGRILVAKSKLDLGDIYLLKGEPWESTLLYSQVEKSNKNSTLSYDAKLRNARLNYYTGNFTLAKSHLDILKKNTTREISNDAISLGMLITDNTALDTNDVVMRRFAKNELLIFQNKKDSARSQILALIQEFSEHAIIDESYWLLSKIALEYGEYNNAISYLDKILEQYQYDILADDAAFKKAEIYEYQLKDVKTAKDLYQDFMVSYPGSMYVAEARKRFRALRGDILN
ncbi:MAG: tetratricopeptide repeat protein [Bacteroidota bacterium]